MPPASAAAAAAARRATPADEGLQAARLLQLLQQVEAGFASMGPVDAAMQLYQAVGELDRLSAAAGAPWGADRAQLKRLLLSLAERLPALSDGRQAGGTVSLERAAVMPTACQVLQAVMMLGCRLELAPQEAFRLAAACQLAFGGGMDVLARLLGGLSQPRCWLQLQLVQQITVMAGTQLIAVSKAVAELFKGSNCALAAYAASTAKPAALLPWMAAVAEALELATEHAAAWCTGESSPEAPSAQGRQEEALLAHQLRRHHTSDIHNFSMLAKLLLTAPAFERHRAALAGRPRERQAIADLLLRRGLPLLAELVGAENLECADAGDRPDIGQAEALLWALPPLLQARPLLPAMARRAQQGGAAELVRHAVAVLRAVPAAPPAGQEAAAQRAVTFSKAATLVGTLANMVFSDVAVLDRLSAGVIDARTLALQGTPASAGATAAAAVGAAAGVQAAGGPQQCHQSGDAAALLDGTAATCSSGGGGSSAAAGGAACAEGGSTEHVFGGGSGSAVEGCDGGSGSAVEGRDGECGSGSSSSSSGCPGPGLGGSSSDLEGQRREAAWAVAAALPHAANVICAVTAAGGGSEESCSLALACHNLAAALTSLHHACRYYLPPQQLDIWVTAADAGLRLQPVLAALHREWQTLANPQLSGAAALLSSQLLDRLFLEPPPSLLFYGATLADRQLAGLQNNLHRRLWRLHTSACRLVCWLADGGGGGGIKPGLAAFSAMDATAWGKLVGGLVSTFNRAYDLMRPAPEVEPSRAGGPLRRRERALCAAHARALQVVAARDAGALAAAASHGGQATLALVRSLSHAAVVCPEVVGPGFLQPVLPALDALAAQGQAGIATLAASLNVLLWGACRCPRLAADMAVSGLIALALQTAQELPMEEEGEAPQLVRQTLPAMEGLRRAGLEAAAQLSGTRRAPTPAEGAEGPGPTCQELRSEAAELAAALEQLAPASGSTAALDAAAAQALSAAARLGALLHRVWARPEAELAAALSLSQAIAVRACANLCCPNVAGGGLKRGDGSGSKLCSGCRTYSYCSQACATYDWKHGGHRLLCKALAQRAAAQAAAAAAEAAPHAGVGAL